MTVKSTPNMILKQPWLNIARATWVVFLLIYLAGYIFSLPLTLSKEPQFVTSGSQLTRQEFIARLEQWGFPVEEYIRYGQLSNAFMPLLYFFLGVFIFWRKSNDWMAIYTSLLLISLLSSLDTLSEYNPAWQALADLNNIFTSNILFLWFFIFPDGRFVPRWTRWVFTLLLATQVWRIFQPDLYNQSFPYLIPVIFGGILISQIYRYRHANAAQRQQIKWVVYGISLGTAPLIIFILAYFIFWSNQNSIDTEIITNIYGGLLWSFFMLILPVSLAFAIFRSRLLNIDIIIRRTLIYGLLTALLALFYFGNVVLLQQVFRGLTGQGSDLAIILTTLVIAVLFNPLRLRIQRIIDLRFYRSKYDATQALESFSRSARDEVDVNLLTGELLATVTETMQPESASFWIKKNR